MTSPSSLNTPAPVADIFEAMHELMHMHRARMRVAMAEIDPSLTLNELRALSFVGQHAGATQKEVVEHSGRDKAQVARMLTLLEERGHLERTASDHDKRSRLLTLSPSGQALFASIRHTRRTIASDMLRNCSPATCSQLMGLLTEIRSLIPSPEDAD
jgi:DNA-binding MarR family transcriptional regulator